MDLHTVERWRPVRTREDLADIDERTGLVAGGTWLFSAPQSHLRELVDLHDLSWPPLVVDETGLEIAATCTISALLDLQPPPAWRAMALVPACVRAFASSPRVWEVATVGGNVCLSLPAGPMISLLAALDATALVWTHEPPGRDSFGHGSGHRPGRTERRLPIEDFVVGPQRNVLLPGDVLRSLHVPAEVLVSRTAFRRVALTAQGRSGAIVIGRADEDGTVVLTVTAATERPVRLAFSGFPSATTLDVALGNVRGWYDDHHGSRSWRRAMSRRLAGQVVAELRCGPDANGGSWDS